ncbi:MAG TPA: sensor domain-containing diguanylate cyclase [Solirubrobacteraceae bacterium]|nr:sensor domain-containing diguanylate cyclase [Solirubrobacteraceae bacterium]
MGSSDAATGNHYSCSLSSVLLARVHAFGGEDAVAEVLRRAAVPRTLEYLTDLSNWISYDEAEALWSAGAHVTHHPQFARAVGEDAVKRLSASPVAALLRSLGSPENVYRQIALTSRKFSVVTTLEAVAIEPGHVVIQAVASPGFPPSAHRCAWSSGLLSQPPVLFGLPAATVSHEQCQAFGADRCVYSITWEAAATDAHADVATAALRQQLEAMRERLHSMFATASDLIGADDLTDVLARITDRAAVEIRAPRYLLAVRTAPGEQLHCHHKGFADAEAHEMAERILSEHPAAVPDSWLVVPVRSKRCDYGRLLAMYEPGSQFFPQERELFEVYAQYAASALDSATALVEAKQRYAQSSALLDLARALAAAGTSDEVARRLAEAVPAVVDCDRVAVYLWKPGERRLHRSAVNDGDGVVAEPWSILPSPGGPVETLLAHPDPEPIFATRESGHPALREIVVSVEALSAIIMPLVTADSLLGLLCVSVNANPERLEPTADLLDRLSGVAAQATSALQNGRLVDQITHQALHDQLTGLANRLQFTDAMRAAIARARKDRDLLQLFYIDLDGFKPVNDEHGHAVGDLLLAAVGERLRACTRDSDTVARLGGDEFAILIDARGAGPEGDELLARFEAALSQPFGVDGRELSIGASIGRAVFPLDGNDAEALLRHADAAMFETKRAHHAALPSLPRGR